MALCKLFSNSALLKTLNRTYPNTIQVMTLKRSTKEKLETLHIPEKPSRPLTPYLRFVKDQRPKLVSQNPQMKVTEVIKQLAANWKTVSDSVKAAYTEKYDKDVQEYTKKHLEYTSNLTEEQAECLKAASAEKRHHKQQLQLKKKMRDNNKPKRPLGPYLQFLLSQKHDPSIKLSDLMAQMKGAWQSLPEEKKNIYTERYRADKKKYDEELAKWETKMINEGNLDLVRAVKVQSDEKKAPKKANTDDKRKKTEKA